MASTTSNLAWLTSCNISTLKIKNIGSLFIWRTQALINFNTSMLRIPQTNFIKFHITHILLWSATQSNAAYDECEKGCHYYWSGWVKRVLGVKTVSIRLYRVQKLWILKDGGLFYSWPAQGTKTSLPKSSQKWPSVVPPSSMSNSNKGFSVKEINFRIRKKMPAICQ